jgi:hypothetical protein
MLELACKTDATWPECCVEVVWGECQSMTKVAHEVTGIASQLRVGRFSTPYCARHHHTYIDNTLNDAPVKNVIIISAGDMAR